MVTGRSVSSALVEAVHELDASTLVIGSSADGAEGRIVTGSTADKLLHSDPPKVGLTAEDSVLDSWSGQAAEAQRRLVAGGSSATTCRA